MANTLYEKKEYGEALDWFLKVQDRLRKANASMDEIKPVLVFIIFFLHSFVLILWHNRFL